ncbi:uncharacterized protein METZ01_LOCUS243865, partial [marine metagenome]
LPKRRANDSKGRISPGQPVHPSRFPIREIPP